MIAALRAKIKTAIKDKTMITRKSLLLPVAVAAGLDGDDATHTQVVEHRL
jgi:hypothetical protein